MFRGDLGLIITETCHLSVIQHPAKIAHVPFTVGYLTHAGVLELGVRGDKRRGIFYCTDSSNTAINRTGIVCKLY